MKKTYKILVLLLLIIFGKNAHSNSDLSITGLNCNITIQAASVQFEGINRDDANTVNNRHHQIFNGSKTRFFDANFVRYDTTLVFLLSFSNTARFASCYYEALGQNTDNVYGFAKYLITFKYLPDTTKSMYIYYNTLDSKCGTLA
jgi:hypothetical protein